MQDDLKSQIGVPSGPRKSNSLAVIPARGGSKRMPGKNVRELGGRPIIAYTIEAARECGLFSRVIVSTDSEEIAEVALAWGAEVPFLREAALADDHTPVSLVTVDALERLDPSGEEFAHVAQLMPNCPLRTSDDILKSYDQMVRTGARSQLSVFRFGWQNPWWAMLRSNQYELQPLFDGQATARSQDLPDLFCPTGAVWWAEASALRRERTFHMEGRTGWEIAWEHAVDIDTEDDWRMAELLMGLMDRRQTADGGRQPSGDGARAAR